MSYSVAIIGSREEIIGFSAVGVKIFPVDSSEEASEVLFRIKKAHSNRDSGTEAQGGENIAIIFVIENLLREIPQSDYAKLTVDALPAIIPLPGCRGSTGFGDEKIRRIVEKAVGSDIFAN